MSNRNVVYSNWLGRQQSEALRELRGIQRYLYQLRNHDQQSPVVVGYQMALEAQRKVVALWKEIEREAAEEAGREV